MITWSTRHTWHQQASKQRVLVNVFKAPLFLYSFVCDDEAEAGQGSVAAAGLRPGTEDLYLDAAAAKTTSLYSITRISNPTWRIDN
jgi:hypothetical protein